MEFTPVYFDVTVHYDGSEHDILQLRVGEIRSIINKMSISDKENIIKTFNNKFNGENLIVPKLLFHAFMEILPDCRLYVYGPILPEDRIKEKFLLKGKVKFIENIYNISHFGKSMYFVYVNPVTFDSFLLDNDVIMDIPQYIDIRLTY